MSYQWWDPLQGYTGEQACLHTHTHTHTHTYAHTHTQYFHIFSYFSTCNEENICKKWRIQLLLGNFAVAEAFILLVLVTATG